MIQPNELRVGNWVLFDLEEVYEQITTRSLGFIANSISKGHSHPFKPITLTEEILLRCGFIWNSAWGCFIYNGFMVEKIGDLLVERKHGVCIKTVHQLQNLYMAITNKELQINISNENTDNTNRE